MNKTEKGREIGRLEEKVWGMKRGTRGDGGSGNMKEGNQRLAEGGRERIE